MNLDEALEALRLVNASEARSEEFYHNFIASVDGKWFTIESFDNASFNENWTLFAQSWEQYLSLEEAQNIDVDEWELEDDAS